MVGERNKRDESLQSKQRLEASPSVWEPGIYLCDCEGTTALTALYS